MVTLRDCNKRIKVRAYISILHWKTLDCRWSQTLRRKICADIREDRGMFYEKNLVDDCVLFWLKPVSCFCKHCIGFAVNFTVYLVFV